jgi:hypothetical protein
MNQVAETRIGPVSVSGLIRCTSAVNGKARPTPHSPRPSEFELRLILPHVGGRKQNQGVRRRDAATLRPARVGLRLVQVSKRFAATPTPAIVPASPPTTAPKKNPLMVWLSTVRGSPLVSKITGSFQASHAKNAPHRTVNMHIVTTNVPAKPRAAYVALLAFMSIGQRQVLVVTAGDRRRRLCDRTVLGIIFPWLTCLDHLIRE